MTTNIAPQECDVTKCPYFEENYGEYYQGHWEDNNSCYEYGNHCSDNPNCSFKTKQLHLQQKTFTLEEIENKIKKVEEFYGEQIVTVFINDLLAEFEKEL